MRTLLCIIYAHNYSATTEMCVPAADSTMATNHEKKRQRKKEIKKSFRHIRRNISTFATRTRKEAFRRSSYNVRVRKFNECLFPMCFRECVRCDVFVVRQKSLNFFGIEAVLLMLFALHMSWCLSRSVIINL